MNTATQTHRKTLLSLVLALGVVGMSLIGWRASASGLPLVERLKAWSAPGSGALVLASADAGTKTGASPMSMTSLASSLNRRLGLLLSAGERVGTASVALDTLVLTKSFSPNSILLNGISTLTFDIMNTSTTVTLTGVTFTDTLPAGLIVATPNGINGFCTGGSAGVANGNAGGSQTSLLNTTLVPSSHCTYSINVQGTTVGPKLNSVQATSDGGTSNVAQATLEVGLVPVVSKSFNPTSIPINGTTTLTLDVSNPSTVATLTNVHFTDTLPAGLIIATPNNIFGFCTGGSAGVANGNSGGNQTSLLNTTLVPSSHCTYDIRVTATTAGTKVNNVTVLSDQGTGNTAQATLVVTCIGPTVTTHPVSQAVCEGGDVTFTAAASGTPAPTVQWQVSTNGGGTFTDIPGATSTSLPLTNVTAAMNGYQYHAVFTNDCGDTAITNPATLTVNRCAYTLTDPLACTGPGNAVTGTLTITNNGAAPTTVLATVALPPGDLLALPGTCITNVGTCTVVNAARVDFSATLAAGQTATVTYLAQVADQIVVGTQLCSIASVSFGGGPPATVQACVRVTCPAVGPGLIPQAVSPPSDQKAGSVLFYNLFTSSPTSPGAQNTRISMTNTHPVLPAFVHLFFVEGSTCGIADAFICLTRNETVSFLTSNFDPGTTGYLVAVAVDRSGCPVNFNYLIGDEYVKLGSGHAANLGAEAISALAGGLPFCNASSETAVLAFDGVSYNLTPRVLAVDNIADRATGNDTLLVVNRVGGSLLTSAGAVGSVFGLLYNDSEQSHSFSFSSGNCQVVQSLSNSFPRTSPPFETVIPSGHSGWMKFWGSADIGIFGVAINFNPNALSSSGAFSQGHNLHKLRLTTAASVTIPVIPPSC